MTTHWADVNALKPGDTAACELEVNEGLVAAFAQLSEDVNPLHLDAEAARTYGFPRRVAHGLIAVGAISRLIGTQLPGPGALWLSHDVEFTAPALVGDRLVARVTVEQVSRSAGIAVLRTEAENLSNGTIVLRGTARVKVLPRLARAVNENPNERVALVTGGSRGLGRAIALKLGASGMKVAAHYREQRAAAEETVAAVAGAGGEAIALPGDLTQPGTADALFEGVLRAFGRLDVIVNNASPPIQRKPCLEYEWDDFAAYFHVYVRATYRLAQLAAPGMQSRRFGRIVNIVSSSAHGVPPPRLAAYVTAKSALAGLARALAVELGPHGITVNMVSPSLLITDQNAALGDRARQLAASQSALRRLAELDEVAEAVTFLASDAAGFVTGAVLPVAGGEVMPA